MSFFPRSVTGKNSNSGFISLTNQVSFSPEWQVQTETKPTKKKNPVNCAHPEFHVF